MYMAIISRLNGSPKRAYARKVRSKPESRETAYRIGPALADVRKTLDPAQIPLANCQAENILPPEILCTIGASIAAEPSALMLAVRRYATASITPGPP